MGVVQNVGFDKFPIQGDCLNKNVLVCFNYNTNKTINGTIVRDDIVEPYRTIIKLNDGRYILGSECQYTVL